MAATPLSAEAITAALQAIAAAAAPAAPAAAADATDADATDAAASMDVKHTPALISIEQEPPDAHNPHVGARTPCVLAHTCRAQVTDEPAAEQPQLDLVAKSHPCSTGTARDLMEVTY
jgi:hypothetical protein